MIWYGVDEVVWGGMKKGLKKNGQKDEDASGGMKVPNP